MPEYVKRNQSKKRKRKLKKSFVVFLLIIFIVIIAIVFLSIRGCTPLGNTDTSSDISSEETVSQVITHPESTSVTLVPQSQGPSFTVDTARGGDYLNVGTDYICEVVNYEAETLAPNYLEKSCPTDTPLPIGTVDYCSGTTVTNGKSETSSEYRTFVTLRCGKQVYKESLKKVRTKIYDASEYGALPETNNVTLTSFGISSDGRYSTFTLDVDWKAPFTLTMGPQGYRNEGINSDRDYSVDAVTFKYIDITFKYCDKAAFENETLTFDGTIFSGATWIKGTAEQTLRLTLNTFGGCYGWYAEYDSKGDLVFKFLNPKKATVGQDGSVNLNGAVVYLDVGHGGADSGAVATLGDSVYYESDLNLRLAKSVKTYLEQMGAKVVLSRDSNEMDGMSEWTAAEGMQKIRDTKPDFVLAIHHDSGGETGFKSYHYNAFSATAADKIRLATANASLYSDADIDWHIYYGTRVMYCPSVLTENGHINNPTDLKQIIDDSFNEKRAKALADGVADYFKSLK